MIFIGNLFCILILLYFSFYDVSEKIKNVSGKHFLTAVVAGYEVATRVGSAAGTELLLRGFHPQGTHGTIASAVTAAKLMTLNKEQTKQEKNDG